MRTDLEVTQEEIYTSSDEQDAQKREQEEGGSWLTFAPEVLNIDEESEMDCHAIRDGSSDGREKSSRSIGSSTISRWQWKFKIPTL